jgi:hypothetical protein
MTRSKRVITPAVLLLALDAHLREAVTAPELELEQPHADEVTDPGLEDELYAVVDIRRRACR